MLRYPHRLTDHTDGRFSKCKRCHKQWDICQCGSHGYVDHKHVDSVGWRICFRPCTRDQKYWPVAALGARELESWEYRASHPGHRPVEEFHPFDDSTTEFPEPSVFESQDDGQGAGHY